MTGRESTGENSFSPVSFSFGNLCIIFSSIFHSSLKDKDFEGRPSQRQIRLACGITLSK